MGIWTTASRAEREQDRAGRELVDQLTDTWRRACEHVGLSHAVQVASGTTIVVPTLARADVSGPDPVLIVKLMPGQLAADFRAPEVAERLSAALGCDRIRVESRGPHWVRIELLTGDPLAVDVTTSLPARDRSVSDVGVLVARDELGRPLAMRWDQAPHTCVQGATRSGKSVWCYSVLAQLARLDDVLIAGSDPSGLLLGRPWAGTRHHQWQATGSGDVLAHRDLLDRLVAEMDARIAELPARQDKLTVFTPDRPLIVVVLEELAGLLRLASTTPTPKGELKVREQLLHAFGRLVSEGHKAGMRLLVVTQRADATIIEGFARGQLGLRLSFRADDPEALVMLHGQDARAELVQHRQSPPGVALVQAPGIALTRARGPRLPGPSEDADYARYWDEVAGDAPARLHQVAA